jgi:hypothetical protein
MSDATSALSWVGHIRETVRGVTDASPAFTEIHRTNFDPKPIGDVIQDDELRADGDVVDSLIGPLRTEIKLDASLIVGAHDWLIEQMLGATFPVAFAKISAITISAAAADQSYNGSATTEFTNVAVGDWIIVAGFTTPANNGVKRVLTKTNAKITVDITDAGVATALENEIAGDAVTVDQQLRLAASSSQLGESFIRKLTEWAAPGYEVYPGCFCRSWTLTAAAKTIAKVSSDWMGLNGTLVEPATPTYVAATEGQPCNTVSGTPAWEEAGVAIAYITGMTLQCQYGSFVEEVCGATAGDIRDALKGRRTGSGTLTAWFPSHALLTKYKGRTETSIEVDLKPSSYATLGYYTVHLPRIVLTSWAGPSGGDGPIRQDIGYNVERSDTFDYSIAIIKVTV